MFDLFKLDCTLYQIEDRNPLQDSRSKTILTLNRYLLLSWTWCILTKTNFTHLLTLNRYLLLSWRWCILTKHPLTDLQQIPAAVMEMVYLDRHNLHPLTDLKQIPAAVMEMVYLALFPRALEVDKDIGGGGGTRRPPSAHSYQVEVGMQVRVVLEYSHFTLTGGT